ncbi:hypothetical protein H6F74_26630 [Trichocoleus sp. FACHB-90]|uniref:hypothetical protein n=1 Tax=Cyanophyceae TaxID=3028117 RepID=UPI001681C70A|nr:hypothetical protein [Trichocoleus sp. FACHB-90]MBD1929782.1 hypothetical protein [Trichocoleus sp. FACHB-90]
MGINWEDPNFLIGSEGNDAETILSEIETSSASLVATNIQKKIAAAQRFGNITFDLSSGEERYIIIENTQEQNTKSSISIHNFNKRNFNWILNDDPNEWRFIPNSAIYCPSENPIFWGMWEFTREMSFWPPALAPHLENCNSAKQLIDMVNGHYTMLMLWLRYSLPMIKNSSKRDKLRELLYTTDLIYGLPYADLSLARYEFARQVYPWSELAQRAGSSEHLWFCMEYSNCLHKAFITGNLSKDQHRTNQTNNIRRLRQASKKGTYDEIVTIDDLQEEGKDWRLFIEDLILQDIVKVIWENEGDTKTLEHYYKRYLDAMSHYNGIVGHKKEHVILSLTSDQQLIATRKGQKLNTKSTQPRSRGRPPGSRNVKKY